MPDRLPEKMSDRISEQMSDGVPERMRTQKWTESYSIPRPCGASKFLEPSDAQQLHIDHKRPTNSTILLSKHSYLVGGWATPLKNMRVNWDD